MFDCPIWTRPRFVRLRFGAGRLRRGLRQVPGARVLALLKVGNLPTSLQLLTNGLHGVRRGEFPQSPVVLHQRSTIEEPLCSVIAHACAARRVTTKAGELLLSAIQFFKFTPPNWTLIKCISFGTINVTSDCVNFVTVLIIGLTTGQHLPRKPRPTSTLNRHSDVMPRTRNT